MVKFLILFGIISLVAVNVCAQSRPTQQPSSTSSQRPRPSEPTSTRGPPTEGPTRNPSSTARPDPSIVNGEPAETDEFPFQALLVLTRNGTQNGFECGGSLIDANWVLTAAHCFPETDRQRVQLGHISRYDMTYSEWSYERYTHPDFNTTGQLENDIALIKLPTPAPINTPNIDVIQLPSRDIGTLENEIVQASGFGVVDEEADRDAHYLQKVSLRVISTADCQQHYSVSEQQICTVWSTMVGQNHCEGDSGGPISYRNGGSTTLVGVASFGSARGCAADRPSGNTRVSEYLDWIQQTMAANP